jgi:hypothetical protein
VRPTRTGLDLNTAPKLLCVNPNVKKSRGLRGRNCAIAFTIPQGYVMQR